jgi:hypothetical protein
MGLKDRAARPRDADAARLLVQAGAEWVAKSYAACRDADADLFFPVGTMGPRAAPDRQG